MPFQAVTTLELTRGAKGAQRCDGRCCFATAEADNAQALKATLGVETFELWLAAAKGAGIKLRVRQCFMRWWRQLMNITSVSKSWPVASHPSVRQKSSY